MGHKTDVDAFILYLISVVVPARLCAISNFQSYRLISAINNIISGKINKQSFVSWGG